MSRTCLNFLNWAANWSCPVKPQTNSFHLKVWNWLTFFYWKLEKCSVIFEKGLKLLLFLISALICPNYGNEKEGQKWYLPSLHLAMSVWYFLASWKQSGQCNVNVFHTQKILMVEHKKVDSVHFLEKGRSPSNVNLLDRKSIRLIDNIANCALTFGMK